MHPRPHRRAAALVLLLAACYDPAHDAPPAATAEAPAPDRDAPLTRDALLRMMSPAEVDALEGARGLVVSTPDAFDGVTLFAPLNSSKVHLIDLAGEVVHTWETGYAPGAWCYLLADGTLLHLGRDDRDPKFKGGGIGGVLRRLAPDGSVLWTHRIADDQRHQHHDVEPLPNGNLLAIVWEKKTSAEAIARGAHADLVGDRGLWPDAVLELEPTGAEGARVVWEWHAWDHLVQDVDPEKPGYGVIADHPGRIDVNATYEPAETITAEERRAEEQRARDLAAMGYAGGEEDAPADAPADAPNGGNPPNAARDAGPPRERGGDWLHTNAVAWHPELDLILLSSPELSEILVIDHSTTTAEAASSSGGRYGRGGEILWRWGNPEMHGAGDASARRLFYQHDPTWIGGADDLRCLVFNNGGRRPDGSSFSEVLELELPFDAATGFACAPRAACGPAEPAWRYASPETFFSGFISGAQRLPNGNTLICSGAAGRILEVARDGRIVWEYHNPLGGDVQPPEHAGKAPPLALFRATRLAHDHPGVVALLR